MAAIPHAHVADPILPGLFNGQLHGHRAADLAHAVMRVDEGGGPVSADDLGPGLGIAQALIDFFKIQGNAGEAVGGHAAQIRVDEMISHAGRVLRPHTAAHK